MEVTKIVKTQEGWIKVYFPGGHYTFWHEAEMREFAARDLKHKPASDSDLQGVIQNTLKLAPTLDKKDLDTVVGTSAEIATAAKGV